MVHTITSAECIERGEGVWVSDVDESQYLVVPSDSALIRTRTQKF